MEEEDFDISEEFLQELTKKYADIQHPLFMDELPEDISSNPDLEALHKLLSEGETRDSIAQKYKEVGNGYVAEGRHFYRAAISSYTDGIGAESKDDTLNSQLHSNRALVYLRLGDYVKCVNDCRRSIKFDKFNYKSYYRGALASFNLSLYKQSLLFCTECAKVICSDPNLKVFDSEKSDNFKLLSLVDDKFGDFYKKVLQRYSQFELEKRKMNQRDLEESEMKLSKEMEVLEFLNSKGLKIMPNLYDIPESQTVVFYLNEGKLHTSCLFVYDQLNLSDFIRDFDYSTSVSDHLEAMFGPDGQFTSKNSLCFYQVSEDSVIQFEVNSPFEHVVFKSSSVFRVPVVHIVTDPDSLVGFTKM